MLIDNLKIQCFRGIPDSLFLDLSAPLTVLYAPNGTGKTSICDAVEWVLCGRVGRLDKDDSIRCKLSDEHLDTFVEASIPQGDSPFLIKRMLSDSGTPLFWKDDNGNYNNASDQELLRRFVSGLPPSGNSNKAKTDWVRSTRFLENDSLNLLIDSDKESNDTRKLIFSSLFGVSEYQKNERDLNRILNKLPSKRKIENEKEKSGNKITEYKGLIKKLAEEQSAPYLDHASNMLNTIEGLLVLKINIDKKIDVQEYYKQLEVKYIQIVEAFNARKSSLRFVRNNLRLYQDSISHSFDLEKKIKADNEKLKALKDRLASKNIVFEEKKKAAQERNLLLDEITEALGRIKDRKASWKLLHQLYSAPHIEAGGDGVRASRLSDYVMSQEQEISSWREKILLIDEQIKLIPSWIHKLEKLNGIDVELKALQVHRHEEKEQASVTVRISKIKSELDAIQNSRERVLSEIEVILTSGKRYVEKNSENSECPLCEYNYESNQVLREKINSRFSKLSRKSKEEGVMASKLEELTRNLVAENSRLKKFEDLVDQKNQLANEVQQIEGGITSFGVNKLDLSKFNTISEKLNDIRAGYQSSITELSQKISSYIKANDAANKLEEIRVKSQSLFTSWNQRLNYEGIQPLTIDNLDRLLEGLELAFEKKNLELKQLREDSTLEIRKLTNEIESLEVEKSKTLDDIASSREMVAPIQNIIQDNKLQWSAISNAENISDSEIEKVTISIDERERVFHEVKSLFSKTEEYFVKIRESEKRESEYGLYKNELEEACKELTEWERQGSMRAVVEREVGLIKEEIRRFISEEIRPLSNIINTLYLRAQGNRFISSIEARPTKEGFLDWIAEVNKDGESFDKMNSLSQGQRQDLALSIFLARARSLGGTFFLDEPLAHLDDLNRVALLDTLRIIISEKRSANPLRLVLTTASNNLLRHLREKFSLVEGNDGNPALRIYKMSGNPKVGLHVPSPELVHSPNKLMTVHT